MRVRIDLGYDGTDFHGWARQPGLRTIQDDLEDALGKALRIDPPTTTCAGRTDTGVHARGQVVHVDLPGDGAPPDLDKLHHRLCRILPGDVVVTAVGEAAPGFDARFSALRRHYVYRICDGRPGPDPLTRRHTVHLRRRLDVDAMRAAAAPLAGTHDFAAFCRRRPGGTTIRTLLALDPVRRGDLVDVTVVADAFCHSMVRALVGGLRAVGEGRYEPPWLTGVLERGRRDPRVGVMAARGLTLEHVDYPNDPAAHAARAAETRRRREVVGSA